MVIAELEEIENQNEPGPSLAIADGLSARDLVSRATLSLTADDAGEALRMLGIALLLEPGLPAAQLRAAQALDALGLEARARELLSTAGFADRLDLDGLLLAIEIGARHGWREVALPMLVHAYLMQPGADDLARINDLATPVLDGLAPEITSALPRETRPVQTLVVGRNDLCPCGSGKKYKRCCMRRDQETPRTTSRSDVDNLHALALLEEQSGRQETARQLWERLVDRFPAHPLYWYRLGIVRARLGHFREAIAAFERMERVSDRTQDFPVEEWALALDRIGRHKDALRVLDQHPRSSFATATTLALRADILKHLNRMPEARDALLSASRHDGENVEYLVALADLHQLLGEVEQSAQAAAEALAIGQREVPDEAGRDEWVDLLLGAAAVLAGLGYYSEKVVEASSALLKLTASKELRAQAMAVRAHALLTMQRSGEAASAVEEALAIGESLDLYLVGAAAASQLGDNQTRSSYLRDAVRLLENDESASSDEVAIGGLIAAILRQYNRALSLADRALEADPGSDVAVPLRAHCLLRLDRAEEALATARTRRAIAIPSPLLIVTRAEALGRLGRHSECLAELSGPLPIDKSALAPLLGQLQDVDLNDRKEMLRARAFRNLGKSVESISILKDLVKRSPRYVDAWEEMAAHYLDQQDAITAHRALLEAERLDPGRPNVREKLAYAEGVLWVTQKGRNDAEKSLRRLLGPDSWNALAEESRLALTAAEISNRNTVGVETASDFGPIVAQLARTAELELHRRVFEPFREAAIRMRGRSGFQASLAEEYASEQLFPFLRFLRTPQGGLSLGPMLAVTDLALAGEPSAILALLRRFLDSAYASPNRARELLTDQELRLLNATRNQGLHRTTVHWDAAKRSRRFLLGDAPGRGWLVGVTRHLNPLVSDDVLSTEAHVRRPAPRPAPKP